MRCVGKAQCLPEVSSLGGIELCLQILSETVFRSGICKESIINYTCIVWYCIAWYCIDAFPAQPRLIFRREMRRRLTAVLGMQTNFTVKVGFPLVMNARCALDMAKT